MPAFRFEASNSAGRIESGLLEADGARQARLQLKDRGLTPISVEATASDGAVGSKHSGVSGRLKNADLAICTRQLASLLAAGLPLGQALAVVTEQAETDIVRERFGAVRSEVLAGHSLSDAMNRFPKDFPDIYRSLVTAGEQSGNLSLVMERLADHVESRSALAQKVGLAFLYPAVVTLVAISVIIGLLTYVVPQVVGVFSQTRQKLPFLTIAMLEISNFLRDWGWLVLAALIVAWFAWRFALRRPEIRLAWDALVLRLPIIGRIVRGVNTARFSSTLAILAASGVPLLKALEAGGQTLGNTALKANVADAIARVREGAPLARALGIQKQFPPMLIHFIASGESTGKLPEMLDRAATAQAAEVERKTMALTTLLEPLLVVGMGIVVLLIVLAVLLPIIEINTMVK
jgi:general secretion pathway protein F